MGPKTIAFAAVAAFVALLSLAGCETMSPEQCAGADWRALGFQDASNNGVQNLSARADSCAKASIAPDQDAYQSGFAQGMVAFCRPAHGFQFAADGHTFAGICPDDLEPKFRPAYQDGQIVARADQDAQEARSQVSSLESRIEDIRHQLATDHPGNVRLEDELRDKLHDLPRARREVDRREWEARRMREDLSRRWLY